eukprot:7988597-Alexandrium_andersonii.AAC.1
MHKRLLANFNLSPSGVQLASSPLGVGQHPVVLRARCRRRLLGVFGVSGARRPPCWCVTPSSSSAAFGHSW